nr:acrosin-like [Camelus dromedarius]
MFFPALTTGTSLWLGATVGTAEEAGSSLLPRGPRFTATPASSAPRPQLCTPSPLPSLRRPSHTARLALQAWNPGSEPQGPGPLSSPPQGRTAGAAAYSRRFLAQPPPPPPPPPPSVNGARAQPPSTRGGLRCERSIVPSLPPRGPCGF